MDKKIEILIVKFLTSEANVNELSQLEVWISDPKNEILFVEYIKADAYVNKMMSNYDVNSAKKNIMLSINRQKRKTNNVLKYAAAALFIGLLTSSYFFYNTSNAPVKDIPVIVNTIKQGTDKAVLTLGDGTSVALERGEAYQTKNANSNGKQIVYGVSKNIASSEIVYNYLTIPRGGQFFIKLSDGTQVWLNSESQLKYPVAFRQGETRKVELVYGEAYFEVSPSSEHEGAKFKVLNQSQEIEVLGTKFNLKAYNDESHIYTTLVEGKVSINSETTNKMLSPSEQAILSLDDNIMKIAVVDTYHEIAWKDGIFSFRGKKLKDIMRVLSRWYNVKIIFENKKLESVKFKGTLSKEQSIEEILSIMKSNTINNYNINSKSIILN